MKEWLKLKCRAAVVPHCVVSVIIRTGFIDNVVVLYIVPETTTTTIRRYLE